jgi:hypothetical protein
MLCSEESGKSFANNQDGIRSMNAISTAQFLCLTALMTTLNVSASMTYNAAPEVNGSQQTSIDEKPSIVVDSIFSAYDSDFEVISLAASGLATTASKPGSKPTFVPEPSTIMAGALLLLPFVASVVRVIRKVHTV